MTLTTSKILEDVTNHMNNLIVQHEKLHKSIDEAGDTFTDEQMTEMKKRKLRAKDEIERMKNSLSVYTTQRS